jgi:signal transduction histidine kinase
MPRDPQDKTPRFTVDTHLFRELGELLVGRDSTALVELVKNAYDADASEVSVYAERLDEEAGFIVVTDNGTGMTEEQFRRGFLRIASREKSEGDRRSRRYGRRYTGEKGVGRLAAHKLARSLDVETTPWRPPDGERRKLTAAIDWDEIERHESLDDAAAGITIRTDEVQRRAQNGTAIRLERLRRHWSPDERSRFISEAQAFEPPDFLAQRVPHAIARDRRLFDVPRIRDGRSKDPGFHVEFAGEFEVAAEYWDAFLGSAGWIAEIRSRAGRVKYRVGPTERTNQEYAAAESADYEIAHPGGKSGPAFDARILVRDRELEQNIFRQWLRSAAGIRVYMEGFRVLPYGEPGNDWLSIDADYARRSRALQSLAGMPGLGDDRQDEGLNLLPNDAYVGAVFLTEAGAPRLQMLVNREGFVPSQDFESVRESVRIGVDLAIRARTAAREERREERREKRQSGPTPDGPAPPPAVQQREAFRASVERATRLGAEARTAVARADDPHAREALAELEAELAVLETELASFVREQSILPVLASVGLQMAEFTHEITGLVSLAQSVDEAISRLRQEATLDEQVRRGLAEAQRGVHDLRSRLERQASYLVDVASSQARRRRSRQSLHDRLEAAKRLVEGPATREQVQIENRVPAALRTPPMFPAELTSVLVNLLTNAVKAAGEGGLVRANGRQRAGQAVLVLANTGEAIDLDEAERWFRPFASTTTMVDPVLGQGMGLGLPIARAVVEEYGGTLRFIEPPAKFATAIELSV